MKQIRSSKFSKILAYYLAIMMFLQVVQPMQLYALTSGPTQPEFNSFTPIGTSDMVDLASGDFSYNIPIMDVGGYPINLAYNSGVTMDQEASWVGLGWNLNVGQINRNVRGLPDDFKGDEIRTENNLKNNLTVGSSFYINPQLVGALDFIKLGGGLEVQYNNYKGYSAIPTFGISFSLSNNVSVGMQLSSSTESGATITPNVSLSAKSKTVNENNARFGFSLSPSMTYNSRQGLSSFNISAGTSYLNGKNDLEENGGGAKSYSLRGGSGSISFLNNTFTPTKRIGLKNNGATFSFSGGPDLWGFHGELSFTGYGLLQTLIEKTKHEKAYGYENSHFASDNDLLDFNREKEQSSISKNTLVLPLTNYTYDIYSVQGQSVGGMFRPYRGQVGYVYDAKVSDISANMSMGAEYEGGAGGHIGGNIKRTYSNTYTNKWNAPVAGFFKEKMSNNKMSYENVYFKNIGENRIDQEYQSLYLDKLGGNNAITLTLDANRQATNKYFVNPSPLNYNNPSNNSQISFNSQIKRNERENRNQVIQKIIHSDIVNHKLDKFIESNSNAKSHHTAGYIITDENGNRNIFGETAYNKIKKEVTFATDKTSGSEGVIQYSNSDNSPNNSKGIDHYFNRITTPQYAHTYLLTTVLSSDYEDLTSNGPSDDDLGTYTKFKYTTTNDYNWRIPYNLKSASFSEGFKVDNKDQKGSYIYGQKELKYVTKIVTKTHIAFVDLEDRKDGKGVINENGGRNNSNSMKKIKSIRLYSKAQLNGEIDPGNTVKPIKTAHFIYDYSLCKNIDNNSESSILTNSEIANQNGKLTLKKVYFTYGGSNMGKYTPYVFNYDNDKNPNYNPKAYDIWGNFKPYTLSPSGLTAQDFPYVEQDNRELQDDYASSWSLKSIDLPSGGKIELDYEADDYQFVQNKRALQMFKVKGVCTTSDGDVVSQLYGNGHAKFVVVQVKEEDKELPPSTIIGKYVGELSGMPIYFNFNMNMTGKETKDFVPGYFEMDGEVIVREDNNQGKELLIPMKFLNREGKASSSNLINPITLTGLFFGRNHLPNHLMFGGPGPSSATNIFDIGRSLVRNLGAMVEIFKGPNGMLLSSNCSKNFDPQKSWIRLQEPSGKKAGGGLRVKKIIMRDGWENMLGNDVVTSDIDRYEKKYGQEYTYTLENGTSSGVATYEPNICKENPLIQPFYHKPEKMSAQAYEETPFGESFYPNATVTYSKVKVKNITAADDDDDIERRKTKSGEVITYFYTSYNFPTKSEFTSLDNSLTKHYASNENQVIGNILKGMFGLKINVKTNLNMTQGFAIETNDMNGKMDKQEVINNAGEVISKVEYKYNVDTNDPSSLNSNLTTIDEKGNVRTNHALGMHYDVINELKESYSFSDVKGVSGNVDFIPLTLIVIVVGFGVPELSQHTQVLRTAVTTKVTHKTGILVEKIAYDLGSRVSTKNLAWDANTGQVLLTQTVNEFDDSYYSFNYPAYWYYSNMGMASNNIDMTGVLKEIVSGSNASYIINSHGGSVNVNTVFNLGDELIVSYKPDPEVESFMYRKVWVSDIESNSIKLMTSNGYIFESDDLPEFVNFKIIRSGKGNQQMASMASITLQKNPLQINSNGTGTLNHSLIDYSASEVENPFIINASAIEYSDDWPSQCEYMLPNHLGFINGQNFPVNPYLYNIKGVWRAKRSFAYLTGRSASTTTRNSGFYKQFSPYYKFASGNWVINAINWKFASEVSMYNPYGMELENKDALKRYSSAQYGYNYTLPMAVSSNAKYSEIGFDGFEDYNSNNYYNPLYINPHFGFNEAVNSINHITNKRSHTGKKAIVVKPNNSVKYSKRIKVCDTINN